MSNPEWEDADFITGWEDDFYPDWSKVNLKGFVRPVWFLQDRFLDCFNSLAALLSLGNQQDKFEVNASRMMTSKNIQKKKERLSTILKKYKVLEIIAALFRKLSSLKRVIYYLYITKIGKRRHSKITLSSAQELYKHLLPDRVDKLSKLEVFSYVLRTIQVEKVFEEFDLIQGYAFDGIYPLLANKKYVAFEHGTIRNIPFEENKQGRICAMTYKAADSVTITNCDNIRSVEKLKLQNYQFIPHPINEEFLKVDPRALEIRNSLESEFGADFIIFHPARQHWTEERHPDWEKGNDLLIKAFARYVKEVNSAGLAIFVDWGASVSESKALIKSLGIEGRVVWIEPLPNREMIRYIHASDVVADQFFLGAFGSTMPKAMACKKTVLIYIDESIHEWCFPEMPPILNSRTEEEIYFQLKKVYLDNDFYKKICEQGYQWYLKFHSNKVILDKTLSVYKKLITQKIK
jgi:glycosyltransferase involved in cell wall biosynthesis